jgi:GNAT superfamily N-acetyltransferase
LIYRRFEGFRRVRKHEVLRMYALDLKGVIKMVKPQIPVKYSVHEGPVSIDPIEDLTRDERYAKGDRAIVARVKRHQVAYLFAATTDTWVGEIEDWFNIPQGEVYLYDAYTVADYRGRRVYPFLICAAADYFKKRAYRCAMIFSAAYNKDSIKGIEKCGFRCYEVVDYRNFLGLKSWHYRVGERYVRARLGNEN